MSSAATPGEAERSRPESERSGAVLLLRQLVKSRTQAGSTFQLTVPELQVYPGEFVAIIGESGCGKSTLLDLLALISKPDSAASFQLTFSAGEAQDLAALWRYADETALAGIRRRWLGYVLQTGGLLPYLNVRDNLLLPRRINRMPPDHGRVLAMAQRMGVADCMPRRPDSLSGGQRQRVAVLRALTHSPRLVLADEPTAAVDRQRAHLIVRDLRSLARDEGLSVIMVTHDLDLVGSVADSSYGFELTQVTEHRIHSCLYREACR
ncbi:MAG: ATP-binding cassette domain-containing protein [Gammaproteobacteria bacterium]|nr:ATP-binding cassette domain-containing protein [Gammaproteobacteria bacterium]MCP5417583.1 ATP-binding cassette domain-containing protein [Chromatiaceae bacterium]